MPLTARRHIRKMRGGAQSHLLEADDGHYYVVKFLNNPQHRRILANELIASVLLKHLQISVPESAMIRITSDFLEANPEVHIRLGSRQIPVESGWHFGSRYPGDPARLVVYDFVPDSLLAEVKNLADFLGILVFDKWVSNADGRQSIFFRARVQDWAPGVGLLPPKPGFVTWMIDHGFAFNGPHWDFPDMPVQGLYARKLVYRSVESLDDFQPWLDLVRYIPEELLDQAYRQVPPEWLEGDEEMLERLLAELLSRRKRVPDLIRACRRAQPDPFPNWRGSRA